MNRGASFIGRLSVLVLGISAFGQEGAADRSSAKEHLVEARRFGLEAIGPLIDNVEQSDPEKFPGLMAFCRDYRKAVKGIDLGRAPETWPALDVDALVTRNPNFWRANYELRPGDPGWFYVHAGMLLTAGEATRAQQILGLGLQSRGTPKAVRDALNQMLMITERVIQDANETVAKGIALYDKGDKPGAIVFYRDALKVWPQNSFAHYELGLTLRARMMEEKGKPIPRAGTFQVEANLPKMPEVEVCFAKSREHDPLRLEAYQGNAQDALPKLVALGSALKAWQTIATAHGKPVPVEVLGRLSEGCQEAGAHELALVSRQLVVSRQGKLGREDHTFLSKSLHALAPGEATEAALKFLDNPRIELRELVGAEPE
ncbi:tetratricopeptide repeat protein [Singulisphaera rosea]